MQLSTPDIQQTINYLTSALEHYREARLEALKPKKEPKKEMTPKEVEEAIAFLKEPKLLEKTSEMLCQSGLIGEKTNALIAYLTYTSRKRNQPLQLMYLGSSGSGKTYLQEKVSALIPEEDKIEITTLSENAFYYFGRKELKNKLILIEDLDGAVSSLFAMREIQTKGFISKRVALKDSKGVLRTIDLIVEGPVCISGATTWEKLYEDNANRCLLLYIDTSPTQDTKIMVYQQQQSAGMIDKEAEERAKTLVKNAQRLLKNREVRNPYAPYIELPKEVFKPRRTMNLFLSFIEIITFYHQYQQEGEVLETTIAHIETAFSLLKDTLFRKSDELSGACRDFFEQIKEKVGKSSFQSKELRKAFRTNPNTLKHYLRELKTYGLISIIGGNPYKGFEYQINQDGLGIDLKSQIDKQIEEILSKIRNL